MTPAVAADVVRRLGVWWAIAGGWAIDLWLGEHTREHHDVEVVVARTDQLAVCRALTDAWDLFCLDPPGSGWHAWSGQTVAAPAFQLQSCRDGGCFDLFLETVVDGTWRFRRDERVSLPVSAVTGLTRSGIVVVRPEVQLLYMAKSDEPENAHDFAVARPRLGEAERAWLAGALQIAHPDHPWLSQLQCFVLTR